MTNSSMLVSGDSAELESFWARLGCMAMQLAPSRMPNASLWGLYGFCIIFVIEINCKGASLENPCKGTENGT